MKKEIDLWYGVNNKKFIKNIAGNFVQKFKSGELYTTQEIVQYVGYHIESGNNKYIDCSIAIIHELGPSTINEISNWYELYLDSEWNTLPGIDNDRNKIRKEKEILIQTLNPKNYGRNILKEFKKNSKRNRYGIYSKPGTANELGKSSKGVDRAKEEGFDGNSIDNARNRESGEIDKSLDENNLSIYRGKDNFSMESEKSVKQLEDRTIDEHGTGHANDKKRDEYNPGGRIDNRKHVDNNDREIREVRENLIYDLELIFDVTDCISIESKVLFKHYELIGKEKVLDLMRIMGYKIFDDGNIKLLEKPVFDESKNVEKFHRIDDRPDIKGIYNNYKEIDNTEDYSIIKLLDKFAIAYANKEIVALAEKYEDAKQFMLNEQEDLYKEIEEIKSGLNQENNKTELFEQYHTTKRQKLYTVSIKKEFRTNKEDFKKILKLIIPYKGWYSKYVKDGMKAGFILKSMEDALSFQKVLEDYLDKIDTKNKIEISISPYQKFFNEIHQNLENNVRIKNTSSLRLMANNVGMIEGKHYQDLKNLYDLASTALNKYIIKHKNFYIKNLENDNPDEIILALKNIEEKQNLLPTETERSYDMVTKQQFSTPLGLSLICNLLINPVEGEVILDPSAGEGNLLVFPLINKANVIANEIDKNRILYLKELGINNIKEEDAKHIDVILHGLKVDKVIMNPPFSKDIKKGERKQINISREHVESALKTLKNNGRLVAILGRGMGMSSTKNKDWWEKIKLNYNVRANILIDGNIFNKKGTNFDTRLIVIDNSGKTDKILESEITNYYELFENINKIEKINILKNTENERNKETKISNRGKAADTGNREPNSSSSSNSIIPGNGHSETGTGKTRDIRVLGNKPGKETDERNIGSIEGDQRKDSGNSIPGDKRLGSGKNDELPGNGSNVRDSIGKLRKLSKVDLDKIEIEFSDKKIELLNHKIGYEKYVPEIKVVGSKPHPAILVESTAMASVSLPKVNYKPMLSMEIIEKGAISEAQLEDIILAGAANSQILTNGYRKGYFCGGGTGYGKGRTIAGIILDNLNRGNGKRKAVWLSKNEKAHYDSIEYFNQVGGDKEIIIKNYKAGIKIHQEEGVLLTTYGTLSNKFDKYTESEKYWEEDPQNRIQQIAQWLGKNFDGVIVFDECHMMGNALEAKAERGTKKPSLRALAGVELQRILPNARIIYSSATGASEVMHLAYAERLGLWGDGTAFNNVREFIQAIDASGVSGMEIVSRDLKSLGLYTSKSLSYEGVKYEVLQHNLLPAQKELYNKAAKAWQVILNNINKAVKLNNTSSRAKAAAMSSFWGSHQRFFQQIITIMQMPTVLTQIEKDLEEGRAPVIQLVTTNEAAANREIAEMKYQKGWKDFEYDNIELSPKHIFIDYLKKSFPVQLFEKTIDDNGNEISVLVKDSNGKVLENPLAVEKREQLIQYIEENINVPESALDIIINHFGEDTVAEITGRSNRIVQVIDNNNNYKKVEQKRTPNIVAKEKDDFMDGKRDLLIFSEAGGTGASFHADLTRNNKKQRAHYVLQYGWRADTVVQGFGRTHRSNEACLPVYRLVTTDLKAQRRFLSSISKRLEQLGALTKGQRQTGGNGILDSSFNLENNYAKQALFEFYKDVEKGVVQGVDMDTLEREMALKIYKEDEENGRRYNEDIVFNTRVFLNRIMSLEINKMDKVFDSFIEHIREQVSMAKNKGIYDEGIEAVKAKSIKHLTDELIFEDKNTGAKAFITQIELEIENKKKTFNDINERLTIYGENFIGFFQRKNSQKIYAFCRKEIVDITGEKKIDIKRYSIVNESHISEKEFHDKYFKIENIEDARKLWDKNFNEYPLTRKKVDSIVKGTILPIWGDLPDSINVKRYIDNNGMIHLGRYYNNKDVLSIREKFNIINQIEYSVNDVIELIKNGGKATLSNDFTLSKKKHQGIDEICIGNVRRNGEHERLRRAGAVLKVKNTMAMTGDFYISFQSAKEVIERILEIYNIKIVQAVDSKRNIITGKDKKVVDLEKHEENIVKVGYRNLSSSCYELYEKIIAIVNVNEIKLWESKNVGEYNEAIMPLIIEKQELYDSEILNGLNAKGSFKLILSQNFIQNGDLMDDPRIDYAIFPDIGAAYPLNFQQHGLPGKYEQYVEEGKFIPEMINRYKDVIDFSINTWIPNLKAQGRSYHVYSEKVFEKSLRELTVDILKGQHQFENINDKTDIIKAIENYNKSDTSLKEKNYQEIINHISEYHKKQVFKEIQKNKTIPGKALRGHKIFEKGIERFYKEIKDLNEYEFLQAEIIKINDKIIPSVINNNGENTFFVYDVDVLQSKEGYAFIQQMQNGIVKEIIVQKWKSMFEKADFVSLRQEPLLIFNNSDKDYIKEFKEYLGTTWLPSNLYNRENQELFVKRLQEIHKKKYGPEVRSKIFREIEGNKETQKTNKKLKI